MGKDTDGRVAFYALIAFAFWIFVALPLYYGPRDDPAAYKCPAKENENHGFWEKARCDPVAYFTLWLVGFTGVLAVSTIGLWIVTWRSGVRQSRDMKASVAVGETANRLNREISVASRRAWVTIDGVKLIHPTQFAEDHIIFRVQVTTKNLGETPATSIWLACESYFAENNSEDFASAKRRFITGLRDHPVQLGQLLFPGDMDTYRHLWTDGIVKVRPAIRTLPSGQKTIGFNIFIGVSYRIAGDSVAHITYHPYGMLNVPIGTAIEEGKSADLPRESFVAGEAD